MPRSRRKFVTWLLLAVLSLSPLPGAMAIDMHPASANCGLEMASIDATGRADIEHPQDCAQHQVCATYCQSAPLLPSAFTPMQVGRHLPSPPASETASLVTRCPENIERPPRV